MKSNRRKNELRAIKTAHTIMYMFTEDSGFGIGYKKTREFSKLSNAARIMKTELEKLLEERSEKDECGIRKYVKDFDLSDETFEYILKRRYSLCTKKTTEEIVEYFEKEKRKFKNSNSYLND